MSSVRNAFPRPLKALVFLGAFLLFALEPFLGRMLLPGFGGGAGVWLACLFFYQAVLLLGYAHVHYGMGRLGPRTQAGVQGGLALLAVVAAACTLFRGEAPFIGFAWSGGAHPVLGILKNLTVAAGLPLVLLCTTSAFAQVWVWRNRPGLDPYPLYALSNLGSLAGLLVYPLVLEPLAGLRTQAWMLGAGLVVYVLILGACLRLRPLGKPEGPAHSASAVPLEAFRFLRWVGLAALGTAWMMTQSGKLAADVASVPLVWILPLGVFLGTFVVAFDPPGWFRKPAVPLVLLGVLAFHALFLAFPFFLQAWFGEVPLASSTGTAVMGTVEGFGRLARSPWAQVVTALTGLAAGGLLCHRSLAEGKPEPSHLTAFYLAVALGGCLGGLAVGVGAPLMFDQAHERTLVLLATFLVVLPGFRAGGVSPSRGGLVLGSIGAGLALVLLAGSSADPANRYFRDFFGVIRVSRPHPALIQMSHGTTVHGLQFAKDPLRPAAYYGEASGLGLALRALQQAQPSLEVGVIGLGVGNVLGYGRPDDRFRVYEISPAVIRMSGVQGEVFEVARQTPAKVEILEGDGRILLARDVAEGRRFDLLLVDAFAGGHIPVHLLTVEALRLYRDSLKPGGLLVLHVSHKLPLDEQVRIGLASEGWSGALVYTPPTLGKDRQGRMLPVEMPSLYWVATWGGLGALPNAVRDRGARLLPGGPGNQPGHRSPWTDQRYSVVDLLLLERGTT